MSSSNRQTTPSLSLAAGAFRIEEAAGEAGAEWTGRTTANLQTVRDPFPQYSGTCHGRNTHQSRVVPGLAALPLTGRGRRRTLLSHV